MEISNLNKIKPGELRNFSAFNKRKTFKFWLDNLRDVAPGISDDQRHYVARLLTRFSLVSTTKSMFYFPTFTSLAQIYDEFIQDIENQYLPEAMENAGCQTLLLGGFYLESAKKHYAVKEIVSLGKFFFTRGAIGKRKSVILKIARNFKKWQQTLCCLESWLRNQRLIIPNGTKAEEPLIKIAYS